MLDHSKILFSKFDKLETILKDEELLIELGNSLPVNKVSRLVEG